MRVGILFCSIIYSSSSTYPALLTRQEMLEFGKVSTNSLNGLENSIPPRPSISVKLSFSDVNKPLPLTPTEEECETRPSSIYSLEINDLIDLYLGGSTSSETSSEDIRLLPFGPLQHLPLDASKFYGDGKYSVSESVLCNITHSGQIDDSEVDEVTIKYRYSNPEGRSPTTLNSLTHDYLNVNDIRTADSAKKYRDTLLPTPFTPVSVKSPDLFPDILPLHGPRFVASSPSNPTSYSQYMHQLPTTNSRDTLDKESLESTTHSELIDRTSGLRAHDGEFLWSQHLTIYSEPSGQDQSVTPNENYTTLESKSPRFLPSPYLTGQQATYKPYPTRNSSYSNHDSKFDSSKNNDLPLPRNWSPNLKPSNPAVPRVPLSERSPAIGLSAYQALGPMAWKADKQKEQEQEQNGPLLFGGKKISEHFTSKLKSLDTRVRHLGQAQYHPHSSQLYFNLHSGISGHSIISTSSDFSNDQNPNRYLSLAHTDGSTDLPTSSVKALLPNPALSMTGGRQSSRESGRNTSWFIARKQKFINEKHDAWRQGIKDKITVIATHDSVGLSHGNLSSTLASEAQYPTSDVVGKLIPKSCGSIGSDRAGFREMPNSNWI